MEAQLSPFCLLEASPTRDHEAASRLSTPEPSFHSGPSLLETGLKGIKKGKPCFQLFVCLKPPPTGQNAFWNGTWPPMQPTGRIHPEDVRTVWGH